MSLVSVAGWLRVAACGASVAAVALACNEVDPGDECEGKCDSKGDLLAALDGREDPIARWIRTQTIASNGSIAADYDDVMFGVAKLQNCAKSTIKTFVISDDLLTGADAFPRLISTACSSDAIKASEFFISASFAKVGGFGEQATGEVDTQALELFAWDETARAFRFYATEAAGTGIRFEVEPARCRGCHLTPTDIAADGMHMLPIMNELTRPWSHWKAEPGFESHGFTLPMNVKTSKTFKELVDPFPGSASEFEPIIRAGQDRAVLSRLRARRNKPPKLDEVMTLLRPLFCDEQVNYVSEEFGSGILLNAIVLDAGVRNAYLQVKPDWPWDWVNQPQMRIGEAAGKPEVALMPVRGNANVVYENQLMALGALDSERVLRLRALDWENAALSEFRCRLWTDAKKRFASSPPDLGTAERNSDAMPGVFDAIMKLDGKTPLAAASGNFIAMAEATPTRIAALKKALDTGQLASASCATAGFCQLDMVGWGNLLDTHFRGLTGPEARDRLLEMRNARVCKVLESVNPADDRFDREDLPIRFNNRPSLPRIDCF